LRWRQKIIHKGFDPGAAGAPYFLLFGPRAAAAVDRARLGRKTTTHPVGDASWQDGFDHDAGAASSDDAETEAGAIVHQVDHFHLRPFRVQLQPKTSRFEFLA
jgi:hypothetical protein